MEAGVNHVTLGDGRGGREVAVRLAVTPRGLTGPDTARSYPRLFRQFNLHDARVKVACAALRHKGLLAGLPAISPYLV
jgi:hypothetical protein